MYSIKETMEKIDILPAEQLRELCKQLYQECSNKRQADDHINRYNSAVPDENGLYMDMTDLARSLLIQIEAEHPLDMTHDHDAHNYAQTCWQMIFGYLGQGAIEERLYFHEWKQRIIENEYVTEIVYRLA